MGLTVMDPRLDTVAIVRKKRPRATQAIRLGGVERLLPVREMVEQGGRIMRRSAAS